MTQEIRSLNQADTQIPAANRHIRQDRDCHSSAGAYLPFMIGYYRHGLSDCGGGLGPWNSADCLPNVMIRYARTRKCLAHLQTLAGCYWMEIDGCPEHCYIEGTFNLDFYMVSLINNSREFGHVICAEFLGSDMQTFSSWKFYQFDNLDIRPGNWQMPYGTETEDTKVKIYEITGIFNCGLPDHDLVPLVTFLIKENGGVTKG
ncbi:MAG TPA: hypothetical protein PLI54_01830 [Methanoculleus sp.]|jgi:hypothetical protein|uniref:hypothetical protein n=1 Tax=Methanoculleus sp. TaxID=90427 RepID=UPI002C41817F|nr:hypothetical protein [Methanoculleus sp.]HOD85982.1 hypothetical protein [Methanoculleus sp.]HOF95889.1 hypothetical protein [Methanoculleus sp.]HOI62389.1 hypothetical protein [Methanoculleus sp.]HOS66651.1 hypothetical protein [Methanoculleus sp.]HOZ43613.1 hypothetical protein [Methanoculleus sp.]